MKKRLLSIVLCLLLFLSAIPSLAAPSIDERARLQGPASEALQELMKIWDKTAPTGKRYPDDVAGLYITDDYKAAVVLVRGATTARKNEIRTLVTKPEVIVFKSAKYSYNELAAIADQIDSDGSFELVWWGVGQHEKENAVMVGVYYGRKAVAQKYFKKYGDKVKVEESERAIVGNELDFAVMNETWMKNTFPKLRSMETTETRFVFASAPKVTKTRAVLNKKGESLTLYRFETEKDMQKANAMIKGNTLVYGGKTVYVDTLFPATYYFSADTIALYCGSDAAVDRKLLETYEIAGEYGGYFDNRNFFDPPGVDPLVVDPPREGVQLPPESIKELLARTDGIYIVKIQSVPVWNGRDYNPTGKYALEVTRNIQGISRKGFSLQAYPDVMRMGRSYVLFIRNIATGNGAASIRIADSAYQSTFEIDDRGYVLPIREYGMKAPVKLEKFLKNL
ncbi:MAG TPA: hypothetical protein VN366_08840 [Feifaniaceae bacterium]|nr:hypothetical protein [Feifaniaceae bacterium]